MSEQETARAIDEGATAWAIRLDQGELDPAGRAELEAWLSQDRRRRGALLRAQAGWAMLDRASVMGAAGPGRSEGARPAWPSRRWLLAGGGAAAAAAGFAALLIGAPHQVRYNTALGEVRRIPLADGSLAAINTESDVAVSIRPHLRQVSLERGEVWFQVLKDASRPFVVASGNVRVRAIGTAFSIRRLPTGCEVQVTEGVVEAWTQGDETHKVRVAAGDRAFVSDDAGAARVEEASTAIDRSLAWRAGQVVLDGETLAEAAAEFNRYNVRKIILDDPDLAKERLVGRFRTNEPDAFARAAAATLGVRAVIGEDAIRFRRR